jgi:serine/threonine protein kinase
MKKTLQKPEFKNSNIDTALDILIIDENDKFKLYPQRGSGDEGAVYQYDETTVFKTFDFSRKEVLEEKFKKIELLGKIKDEACEFPQKLVVYSDGTKAGYTMNYVQKKEKFYDIGGLMYLRDKAKIIECLLKLDSAVRRNHDRGIIHGDVRNPNFLIDKDFNPKMVDTDIYAIGSYGFGLNLSAMNYFKYVFKKDCSLLDNDKFAFALMMMQCFTPGTLLHMSDSLRYFKELIKIFDFDKQTTEIMSLIFSDAPDKPYFGDALMGFDSEKIIFEQKHSYYLNSIY